MKLFNRLGQMEMIGLVMIVILLTIGMLFLAQFALNESPEKKVFTLKGLAYSTMSALMRTTIIGSDCISDYGSEVMPQLGKDVLEDCAINSDTSPEGYSQYKCQGRHSCDFFAHQASIFLNETVHKWGKHYQFTSQLVQIKGEKPAMLISLTDGIGCPKKKEKDSSGLFPLQAGDAGLVENVLEIC